VAGSAVRSGCFRNEALANAACRMSKRVTSPPQFGGEAGRGAARGRSSMSAGDGGPLPRQALRSFLATAGDPSPKLRGRGWEWPAVRCAPDDAATKPWRQRPAGCRSASPLPRSLGERPGEGGARGRSPMSAGAIPSSRKPERTHRPQALSGLTQPRATARFAANRAARERGATGGGSRRRIRRPRRILLFVAGAPQTGRGSLRFRPQPCILLHSP
jgi:hypothetical protein